MTHYETLQVSPKASRDVIDAAWKILMRQHHPDKGGDAERARAINSAHDVLNDPKKRALYDLQLMTEKRKNIRTVRTPQPEEAYPPPYSGTQGFSESMLEVLEQLEGDLSGAVERANLALLERLAKSNPMLQIFLNQLQQKQKRKGAR